MTARRSHDTPHAAAPPDHFADERKMVPAVVAGSETPTPAQLLLAEGYAAAEFGADALTAFLNRLTPDEERACGGEAQLAEWKAIAVHARAKKFLDAELDKIEQGDTP